MNTKKRIAITLAVFLVMLCGCMLIDYANWKQQTRSRLQEASSIAETSCGPIEYTSIGKGPAVLLVHGTPGGYDQGMLVSRILDSQEFTFIALSRPGYLGTPLSVGETPEEQADAYAALLDELGIRSAHILAMSGGGPSALQFALRHPDRCQGLILISAITQSPRPMTLSSTQQAFQSVMESVLTSDSGNWILYRLIRAIPAAAMPQDPEIRLPDAKQEELFQELYDTLFPVSLRIAGINNDAEQFSAMPPFPFSEIEVPTLVMHGTNDRNVPIETAEFAASNIPNSEFVEIEGGPHEFFLVRQRQDSFIGKVVSFLENHHLLFSDEFSGCELDATRWDVTWGAPSVDGELTLAADNTTRAEMQSKMQFQYGMLRAVVRSSSWTPQGQTTEITETTDSSFGFEIWTGSNSQCHYGVVMIANGVLGVLRPQPDANNNCSGDPEYQAYLPISNWDAVRASGTIYLTLTWSSSVVTLTVNDGGSNSGLASYVGEAEPNVPLEIRLNADFNEAYIIDYVRVYQVPQVEEQRPPNSIQQPN